MSIDVPAIVGASPLDTTPIQEISPKGGVGTLSRDYSISVVHTLGYMYIQ